MKDLISFLGVLCILFSSRIAIAGSYTTSGSSAVQCVNVSVPNGSTGIQFQVTMTGGDWDLYVSQSACPTSSGTSDCYSWNSGTTAEVCSGFNAPGSCGSGNSTFYVWVDDWVTGGTWTLTVTWSDCGGPPAYDNCAGATILPLDECNWTSFVLPKEATNSGLANPVCLQPSGIGCGAGTVLEDIWYRFTANSSTTVVEAINNNRHMALQVFSGSCGSLIPVSGGCSDNCPSPEVVSISTNSGQTYYVRLMRTNGDGVSNDMDGTIRAYSSSSHANQGVFGTVTAHNSRGSAPTLTLNGSPNSCADVGTLRTGRIQVRNLGGSTMDSYISSESCFLTTHSSSSAYKNMWARVTIPAGSSINGLYFYSTTEGVCPQPSSSTNLRTGYINVYTGTSSCTPNSPCGGTWDNFITSYNLSAPFIETLGTERVDVVPGQTYYIEIWTTSFATDPNFNFDVHVVPLGNPPSNELCNNAIAFAGSGVGCNLGADPACTGYTIPCMATIENSVFYTYESPGVPFQIEVESVFCEGGAQDLQAGIFEMTAGTCLGNLTGSNLVSSACFTGNHTFNINSPLPAGSDYLIWFDGNAGAACTWGFTVLPIVLVDFTVKAEEDHVDINWITASEKMNDHFVVERSNDGEDWERVVKLGAVGNSTETNYYSAEDPYPLAGISYYRLKQVDVDGKYSYSQVRSVFFSQERLIGTPVPNPAKDKFHIVGQKAGDLVRIFNLRGQQVFVLECNYDLEKIIVNFEPGIYLVSLNEQYMNKLKVD